MKKLFIILMFIISKGYSQIDSVELQWKYTRLYKDFLYNKSVIRNGVSVKNSEYYLNVFIEKEKVKISEFRKSLLLLKSKNVSDSILELKCLAFVNETYKRIKKEFDVYNNKDMFISMYVQTIQTILIPTYHSHYVVMDIDKYRNLKYYAKHTLDDIVSRFTSELHVCGGLSHLMYLYLEPLRRDGYISSNDFKFTEEKVKDENGKYKTDTRGEYVKVPHRKNMIVINNITYYIDIAILNIYCVNNYYYTYRQLTIKEINN